ncbi:hypothetical protein HXX76_008214 [Chlamydomonas incerta]|uniref:C3H1-type domain-containing protein n=1 Tax=Chlamydomonas incerta TaxID=51695 RepID=A0A835T7G5_CHLIN|nr:hypothetical protein HXX76_008214 [Chlamydomonas incerta]|eukprot:KAG2433860.1 hypothetical protein HXX76_008214 [Chlamydomonas incerta]
MPPKFLTCVLSRKPCPHCKGTIEVGEDAWPSKSGYIHAACALDLEARGDLVLQPPPCKHWLRRGFCALQAEGRCFFSHPPRPEQAQAPAVVEQPKQQRGQQRMQGHQAGLDQQQGSASAQSANPEGSKDCRQEQGQGQSARPHVSQGRLGTCGEDRDVAPPSQQGFRMPARRNRVRNKFRVSVFRSWLLDTFGADYLCRGSGVLDVAGGKGELAFELLNLNGVPASVLDPRPMQLERYVKRLQEGFYHFSRVFEKHNGTCAVVGGPGPALAAASDAAIATMAALESDAADAVDGGGANRVSGRDTASAGQRRLLLREARTPGHVRMFLTDQVVGAVGRLAALQRVDCGGEGCTNTPEWGSAMAAATAAVLESRRRAKQVEWTRQGFAAAEGHEEEPTQVLPEGHWRHRLAAAVGRRWRRRHVSGGQRQQLADDGTEDEDEAEAEDGEEGSESGAERSGDGSIAVSASEHQQEQEDNLESQEQPESGPRLATAGTAAALSSHAEPKELNVAGEMYTDTDTEAEARAWAESAVRCLLDCSVVVAMHPDQAAEFAVRLALAAGKPFALVPCCVYAAEFPRRKLRSGEQVRSYAQLLAYLQELGGGSGGQVVARELPFEGKNVLLYRCLSHGAAAVGT